MAITEKDGRSGRSTVEERSMMFELWFQATAVHGDSGCLQSKLSVNPNGERPDEQYDRR